MKDFDRDYNHHAPDTDDDIKRHEDVRRFVRNCAVALNTIVPSSRELSLAHTKLEEAMMWANAGLARARYDAEHADPPEHERAGRA